jgi:hypothetical protein
MFHNPEDVRWFKVSVPVLHCYIIFKIHVEWYQHAKFCSLLSCGPNMVDVAGSKRLSALMVCFLTLPMCLFACICACTHFILGTRFYEMLVQHQRSAAWYRMHELVQTSFPKMARTALPDIEIYVCIPAVVSTDYWRDSGSGWIVSILVLERWRVLCLDATCRGIASRTQLIPRRQM